MEEKFKVKFLYPLKDFTDYEKERRIITIRTSHLSEEMSDITFELTIPKYIYDAVKDTSEEYKADKIKHKIKGLTLGSILGQLDDMCSFVMHLKESRKIKKEKLICITYDQSYRQMRSDIQHGEMGIRLNSSFQFFIAYRYYKKVWGGKGLTPEYVTNKKHVTKGGLKYEQYKDSMQQDGNEWFHHHVDGRGEEFEKQFQIVPWTQEREDFLQMVQDKMISINEKLDKFLGNLDENKIEALMANQSKFLTA